MLTKKEQAMRKRGRPATGHCDVIGLRLRPDLERALNQWMADRKEPRLTKQEAIRRLLWKALRGDAE
jgi:hypothetical protein